MNNRILQWNLFNALKLCVWVVMRPTENDSTWLYNNGDISALLGAATSNLAGRKSKCYFIIKFSLLLSIRLCWREIKPDAGKTTENKLPVFSQLRSRFRENSCAADEQACVFGSCAFNKHSVSSYFRQHLPVKECQTGS